LSDSLAKFSRILAGGAMLAFLCAPAHALDVGASIGGIGASASTGSGNGARAGASVGGTSANASIGGGSGVSASIGGAPAGTSASVGLGGNGLNANATVGPASASIGTGTPPGTPGVPGTPGTPGVSNPGLSAVVSDMTNKELMRTKKRCVQVLANQSSFDGDLVALCKLVQTASR
jgi:hypothetical protein